MKQHAIWVEFVIQSDQMFAFLLLASTHAKTSLSKDPGCQRFDVLQDPLQPDRVFFYEIWDTASSQQLHRTTPHYKTFSEALTIYQVEIKSVLRLDCEDYLD